jgi:hypothetical protein
MVVFVQYYYSYLRLVERKGTEPLNWCYMYHFGRGMMPIVFRKDDKHI